MYSPSPFSATNAPPQVTSFNVSFPRCNLDPPGDTGYLEPTLSPEAVGSVLPASPLSSGCLLLGPSCQGGCPVLTKQPWMDAWDTCRPKEIVFPPGSTLSPRRLFPGFCELIREKEGEGGGCCLPSPLSAAIHGD
uniref:Uncharacterized protein n=1 Tax=Pipistrellus kuhlii TaxID=59472 RepID=A0A7J7UA46_PIPKU|nr:hypothetical protein mPipKuh1_009141 [Pipistrellus kuhlii]